MILHVHGKVTLSEIMAENLRERYHSTREMKTIALCKIWYELEAWPMRQRVKLWNRGVLYLPGWVLSSAGLGHVQQLRCA